MPLNCYPQSSQSSGEERVKELRLLDPWAITAYDLGLHELSSAWTGHKMLTDSLRSWMTRLTALGSVLGCLLSGLALAEQLKVGAAALPISPFGPHPDWDGTITETGVWGERFTDANRNGHWDSGEKFEDDPGNIELDSGSKGKYDGIYLAGFQENRVALGKHDDLWTRVVVLEYGSTKLAIVSLDLLGYYSKAKYYGLGEIQKMLDPSMGATEILITSTHNHEGHDAIGPWGATSLSDGKYPKYLRFVDRQIAKAVTRATSSTVPALLKLGRTDPQGSPSLAGMQIRTGGRPPDFFDEELRVMQILETSATASDRVIATLIKRQGFPVARRRPAARIHFRAN
jgi:hypothetical protein